MLACDAETGKVVAEPAASSSTPTPGTTASTGSTASEDASASTSTTASTSASPVLTGLPVPSGNPPAGWGNRKKWDGSFDEQNELLFQELAHFHQLSDQQLADVRALFDETGRVGQGNPEVARHPMSPAECETKLAAENVDYREPSFEDICRQRYMVPLYDPAHQSPADAKACVDRFEFPNIPCRYPVTWASAREAVLLCKAVGKRLCDAHEWEGACYGALTAPEYNFELVKVRKRDDAVRTMRRQHNNRHEPTKRWAYGPDYQRKLCATGSRKSKSCGQGWKKCGTNTYPAGAFPKCISPLGVLDIHGNAAEHMNLPLAPDEMSTHPAQKYGATEMKGSWFVFDLIRAHEDHCRWRAPYWHGSKVMNKASHRNYHLGFRCCASVSDDESAQDK